MTLSNSKYIDSKEFDIYLRDMIIACYVPKIKYVKHGQVGIDTDNERCLANDFMARVSNSDGLSDSKVEEYATLTSVAKLIIKSNSPDIYFRLERAVDDYVKLLDF